MIENDLLDPDKIIANLNTKRIGKKILVYNSTSSTNDIAVEYATNKRNDGLAIFAEEQAAGRGRAGAKWISGRADSILCSIVLTKTQCSAELLSLTLAVAVAEAVGEIGGKSAKIKWPNDILLNNKKIAGILIETMPITNIYVIGVGINVNQQTFSTETSGIATSLCIETGKTFDLNNLFEEIIQMFLIKW